MRELVSLISYLESISRKGYGELLPGEPDEKFSQLADLYLSSGADDRAAIRETLPGSCRLLVIGFSDRMAILAERFADRGCLLRAFAAHSIEDFRHDDLFSRPQVRHGDLSAGKYPDTSSHFVERNSSARKSK